MMERSSRFISLSGLSGISAGICALVGAVFAHPYVYGRKEIFIDPDTGYRMALTGNYKVILYSWLFWIAVITFVAAVVSAFIFTYLRSKKQNTPMWGQNS